MDMSGILVCGKGLFVLFGVYGCLDVEASLLCVVCMQLYLSVNFQVVQGVSFDRM